MPACPLPFCQGQYRPRFPSAAPPPSGPRHVLVNPAISRNKPRSARFASMRPTSRGAHVQVVRGTREIPLVRGAQVFHASIKIFHGPSSSFAFRRPSGSGPGPQVASVVLMGRPGAGSRPCLSSGPTDLMSYIASKVCAVHLRKINEAERRAAADGGPLTELLTGFKRNPG